MTTAINAINEAAGAQRSPVQKALRAAAKATGIGFDYLVTTATRESSLNPMARARSSSASGLFQFIDSTWLATIKEHGAAHGFSREADAIRATPQGYAVDDPAMRRRVMDLRFDPAANALMGAAYTQQNMSQLQGVLGRAPSAGELYIAHFLGAQGASKFILSTLRQPTALAADVFPQAAAANPSIFYERGSKRSLGEVYAALVAQHQSTPIEAQRFASADAKDFSFTKVEPGPLYRNMFSAQRKTGVSTVVNALWAPPAPPAVEAVAARKGFFPMSNNIESAPTVEINNGSAAL
jgi:hypothetical protein